MINKEYQRIKSCIKNNLLASTCAIMLFGVGCATSLSKSQNKNQEVPLSNVKRLFATYTWNTHNESYYTNVFRADNPLGLMYVTELKDFPDISKRLHFRIFRDDIYDAKGYNLEEIIIRPENLSSNTNNLGDIVYSYSFERSGIISQENLGPAKRYMCVAEYWKNGKDPRRMKAHEFFYVIPGVNIFLILFDSSIRPILMQQPIRIVD